jgi:hypothetical protein
MKKSMVLGALLLFFANLFLLADEAILLKLPVRVMSPNGLETGLKKDDFHLYINEERRDIRDLFGKRKQIDRSGDQRHFVLAFNLTETGQQINDGIDAFVDSILMPNDTLTIITPLKIYSITNPNDPAKIKNDIREIVKKDSLEYKKNKISSRENLLREIRKVNRGGSITSGSANAGMTTDLGTQIIMQFLGDYNREWNNFKSKFLIPDMRQYSQVALMLARQNGEKWLINFQQREIMPAQDQFKKAADAIRNFLSSASSADDQAAASSISSGLQTLEKSMLISDSFPQDILLNLLLGANIGYNTILFRSMRTDVSNPDGQSPDYEGILRDLSEKTGGVALDTTSLADGIDAIRKHQDFYYDIIFEFNGKLEDKNIRVETTRPDTKIYYKNKFFQSEIQNLMDYLKEPKINISDFSRQGNKISFTISEFKIGKVENQNAGVMRVKIELIDDSHNTVYRTENTLKSTKKSITISLNLPEKYRGYFQLHIQTSDMMSLKTNELFEYIKL